MPTPSEAESLASIAESLKVLAAKVQFDLDIESARMDGTDLADIVEDFKKVHTEGVEAFTAARKAKRNQ